MLYRITPKPRFILKTLTTLDITSSSKDFKLAYEKSGSISRLIRFQCLVHSIGLDCFRVFVQDLLICSQLLVRGLTEDCLIQFFNRSGSYFTTQMGCRQMLPWLVVETKPFIAMSADVTAVSEKKEPLFF